MNTKASFRRNLCWLALSLMVGCAPFLSAQIGKDHLRVIAGPLGAFSYTIIVDQEFGGEPSRFSGDSQSNSTRDYTGADFNLITRLQPGEKSGKISFNGSWLDDGVSVYRVEEGDVFSWEGIQSGDFEQLPGTDPFGFPGADETVDISTPAFLGFLTPSRSFLSLDAAFGGGHIRGIGWAKIELGSYVTGEPAIKLLDHAMNYGEDSIVVGESQRDPHEGLVPVSRFGEAEVLVEVGSDFGAWVSRDFDGDGDLDLLMRYVGDGFQLWKQDEARNFEAFSGDRISDSATLDAVGDVDGDGDLDVWVSVGYFQTGDLTSSLWLNQGGGSFMKSEKSLPASRLSYFGDLDRDGDLDVVANPVGSEFQSWLNDGSGTFTHHSTFEESCGPFAVPAQLGDLNGDGFVDLIFICDGTVRIALNQGDGSFEDSGKSYVNTNILTKFPGANLALGDMDGDGDLDAVVPNENFDNALWLNDGNGAFALGQTHLGKMSSYAHVGDIDTDGDLDIVLHSTDSVKNWNTDPAELQVYWNEGPDLFLKGDSVLIENNYAPQELVDMDGDGDLDILVKKGLNLMIHRNVIEYHAPPPSANGVDIPDEGLKRGLLEALGKRLTDAVTEEDLLGLKVLDLGRGARGSGAPMIMDFSGLEKAVNLESLDLSGGGSLGFGAAIPSFQANDLSFLNAFTKLKKLYLSGNRLSELSLPDGLNQLEELNLSNNSLTALEFPSGLTELKDLRVSQNQLGQLLFPDDMAALEILWAEMNQLEMVTFPPTMTQLKRAILSSNQLRSLAFPPSASSLEWLSLEGNRFNRAIDFPEDSEKVFYLSLGRSLVAVGEYAFLGKFSGLEWLQVQDDQFDLTTISPPLSNLTRLEVDLPSRTQFKIPTGYTSLKELFLGGDQLESFDLPTDLHRLEQFSLNSPSMSQVQFSSGLTALKHFSFYGGHLKQVTLSDDMVSLIGLELSRNQIETLVIPEGVGVIEEFAPSVFLYENPIRSVTAPSQWNIQANRAFIRADSIAFDSRGNLQLMVTGSFGTVIVEKTTDLKAWKEIGRVEINSTRPQRFQESNAFSDRTGFYRVRQSQ